MVLVKGMWQILDRKWIQEISNLSVENPRIKGKNHTQTRCRFSIDFSTLFNFSKHENLNFNICRVCEIRNITKAL